MFNVKLTPFFFLLIMFDVRAGELRTAVESISTIGDVIKRSSTIQRKCAFYASEESLNDYLSKTPGLNKGEGNTFGSKQIKLYCKLKKEILAGKKNIQWGLKELGKEGNLSESGNPNKTYYGASTSKIVVAASYLNKNKGPLSQKAKGHIRKLIKKSDNRSWAWLQEYNVDPNFDVESCLIKKSSKYCVSKDGRDQIKEFQKQIGIKNSKLWRGNGGNYISVNDMNRFLDKSFSGSYNRSTFLLKELFYVHTSRSRADKYLPRSMSIGGKTGSWRNFNHQSMLLPIKGKFYSMTILSEISFPKSFDSKIRKQLAGKNLTERQILKNISRAKGRIRSENLALMTGGLTREKLGYPEKISCD